MSENFNEYIFDFSGYFEDEDSLEHYGTPRHSGRYPWGSGEKYQRSRHFYSTVQDLRNQGYKDSEIAQMLNLQSSSELTRKYSIAKDEVRAANRAKAIRLHDKGYSKSEIGRIMGMNESSVRNLLNDTLAERANKTKVIADILREDMDKNGVGFVDIGLGVSNRLGVSNDKLKTARQLLVDEGKYVVYDIPTKQIANGHIQNRQVIAKEGITKQDIMRQIDKISPPQYENIDGKLEKFETPTSVSSDRIFVRYAEDGGIDKDGLIELRRGVEDISLKDAHYAQVRIAVDGTHYLKGMAMYGEDIPEGYDIIFNTNKHKGTPKIDPTGGDNEVFKRMKDKSKSIDENPFGASIKLDDELILAQRHYIGKDGKQHLSALNIVSEEGNWEKWSKNLASQFLSKQSPDLAKKQLDYAYFDKNQELNDILKLTNPVVKRKMLEDFADNCDAAAIHLKAAAMPRQQTHVILPFPEMKDNEVYAPNYTDGTRVILIRYPHGGKFELPELTVNNKVASVRKALGNSVDAVGINSNVAARLSGADFDGDSVIVIPDNSGKIKTQSPLAKLKGFDPKESYPYYPGMKVMTASQKGNEMGRISNLITDMTLAGAKESEIARAVKHSMVVIDAEKHKLNWKQSEIDNGIQALKKKYQLKEDGSYGGASTIISRAKGQVHVPEKTTLFSAYEYIDNNGKKQTAYYKKDVPQDAKNVKQIVSNGIYISTGEKAYKLTGKMKYKAVLKTETNYEYIDSKGKKILVKSKKDIPDGATNIKKISSKVPLIDPETGKKIFKVEPKTQKSSQMAEAKDARYLMSSLTSPQPNELIYANYANKLKALANKARKEYLKTGKLKRNKTAADIYKYEVSTLRAKLNEAMKNKPLERKANDLAQVLIRAAEQDNPDMDSDDRKKLRNDKLTLARKRVGADKHQIEITDNEWKAIQSGAVSDSLLDAVLKNTDMDRVKKLATPKHDIGLSASEKALATSMLSSGYTRGDVAKRLGVSTSTLSKYLD